MVSYVNKKLTHIVSKYATIIIIDIKGKKKWKTIKAILYLSAKKRNKNF